MPRTLQTYWHEAFLNCVQRHTESPDRFMTWAAYSVLGAVMKRKFYIKDGLYVIYPNQYIVLVSPPGIGKGTAVQFAWSLVRQTQGLSQLANIISDRVTSPRIIQRIADGWNTPPVMVGQQMVVGQKDHSCTIYSTELSVLIGASDQMLDFLCEGWDRNEYDYDTKNSGSAFIKDMCTSLIGCTVPDFIRNIDRNRNMSIKGGFTSRCLFIYEDTPARSLLHPQPIDHNQSSKKMLSMLRDDLLHISQLPGGEFIYTTGAQAVFDKFMISTKATMKEDSEAVQHFKSRVRAHIFKLAMIQAVSRHDKLVIEECDMANSVNQIRKALETLEYVFRGSGDSDLALATGYVQMYVEKVGAASKKDILKNLYRHMDSDTLDRVLLVLTEIEYFVTDSVGKTLLYKRNPSNLYPTPNGKVKP